MHTPNRQTPDELVLPKLCSSLFFVTHTYRYSFVHIFDPFLVVLQVISYEHTPMIALELGMDALFMVIE